MSSGMVPLELSKDNNQYCKISVFMPNAGSINESVISVTNVGGDSFSVAVSMIRWNANKVFCKLINGTKISNINMYYTVDTERFCFYIKANWYAKIIVSRLGLVNTSKIESINAIPSGAIEVPISWRDKRYSTELGELIGTATGNKSGLMSVEDKKRLGRRFFKGYTKLVESKYWYNHYVALIFGASPASNLGSLIAIDWKGNELISVTRFFGNNDNVKLYLGSNPETNMYELWLGLIGLDGDGSEFIIQSRESIDLDSKTVETLPSYLKVISISWQKNNDFSELGELIGTATGNKSGLMSVEDKKRLGRRFFKGYTKLVESKYWYNHYVALIFGASPASNLGSLIAIDWKGDEPISVTRFLGNNDNVKLYLGRNPETNMHELWLGLIGLDGDGSEFIIQSRESIDLDSKTVETLPSYLKVIPISWQKNNDFSELGELIPLATNEANGLMSKNNYIKIAQSITSTKLIK